MMTISRDRSASRQDASRRVVYWRNRNDHIGLRAGNIPSKAEERKQLSDAPPPEPPAVNRSITGRMSRLIGDKIGEPVRRSSISAGRKLRRTSKKKNLLFS